MKCRFAGSNSLSIVEYKISNAAPKKESNFVKKDAKLRGKMRVDKRVAPFVHISNTDNNHAIFLKYVPLCMTHSNTIHSFYECDHNGSVEHLCADRFQSAINVDFGRNAKMHISLVLNNGLWYRQGQGLTNLIACEEKF